MKNATRYKYNDKTKKSNCSSEKQITKLKRIIKKLKRITEKTINTIEENTWTKIAFKNANVAFSTFLMFTISALLK